MPTIEHDDTHPVLRTMMLEKCRDGLCDQCPEIRAGILSSALYICDCCCHD